MTRPIIFLLIVLVANIAVQDEALSQAPDMKKYAESMRNMQRDMDASVGGGSDGPAAAPRNRSRPAKKARPAKAAEPAPKVARPAARPSAQPTAAPATVPSFKLFETKPSSLMAVLDIDGDGQLSGSEIDYAADQLLRLDANDNGEIESDELPDSAPAYSGFNPAYTGPGEQIYKTISGFDKNADGQLTRSEMKAEYRGVFRTIDSDGDRSISPKELLGYVKNQ